MKTTIVKEIELPQGITAAQNAAEIVIKGPKGETKRKCADKNIRIETSQEKIRLSAAKATKREKRMINTLEAHIKNMIKGVQQPYVYKMKICSGHFPMTAVVQGDKFIVKNFLGEKTPRTITLKKGVSVKVEGANVTVESCDLELAGQTASHIEQMLRVGNKDRRIFQDGIYLTEKPHTKK